MSRRHLWVLGVVAVACATGKPGLRYSDVIAPLTPPADAAPLLTRADMLVMRVPPPTTVVADAATADPLQLCIRADAVRDGAAIVRHCGQRMLQAATATANDIGGLTAAAVMLRGIGLGSEVQEALSAQLSAIEQRCPRGCAGTRNWFGFMAWQMRQRLDLPQQPLPTMTEHSAQSSNMDDVEIVKTSSLVGSFDIDRTDQKLVFDTGDAAQIWVRSAAAVQWGDESAVRTRSWQARRVLRSGSLQLVANENVDVLAFDDGGRPMALRTAARGSAAASTAAVVMDDDNNPVFAMIRGRAGWPGDDQNTLQLARVLMTKPITASALALVIDVLEDDSAPSATELNALLAPAREKLIALFPSHPTVMLAMARDLRAVSATDALPAYRSLVTAQPRYVVGMQAYLELVTELRLWDEANTAVHMLLDIDHTRSSLQLAAGVLEQTGHAEEARALARQTATEHQRHLAARAAGRGVPVSSSLLQQWSSPWRSLPDALWWDDRDALRALVEQRASKAVGDDDRFDDLLFMTNQQQAEALTRMRASKMAVDWQEGLGVINGRQLDEARSRSLVRRRAGAVPVPAQPMVRLMRQRELQLQPDGSAYVLHHELMEVRSKEAISALGEVAVGDEQRLLRWAVHKPDGRVLHAERPAGIDDLALPGLAPFDIVELATLSAYGAPKDGHREVRWLWDDAVATLEDAVVVRLPKPWLERVAISGTAVDAPSCGQDWCEVRAGVAEHAAVPAEPLAMSNEGRAVVITVTPAKPSQMSPVVVVARLKRQQQVQWVEGDMMWLREVATAMTGPTGLPVEQARRISAHLAMVVQPGANSSPVATLVRGDGDAAWAFGALLTAANIDHERWLLHRPAQGDWRLSSSPFDVQFFRVGDQLFVFDGTLVAAGTLPMAWRGAMAVRIDGDDNTPTELPVTWFDVRPTTLRVDLKLDAAAHGLRGMVVFEPGELAGDWLRQQLRSMTDEQLRSLLEQLLQPQLPGLRVTEALVPALRRADQPFAIGCAVQIDISTDEVRLEHLWQQGALASIRADLPLSTFDVPSRAWPMWMAASDEVLELQLQLPPNATFTDIPPDVRSDGAIAIEQSAYVDSGVLFWRRRLTRTEQRVDPDQWPGVHADLMRAMAGADAKIVFILDKPSPVGGGAAAAQ